MRKNSVLAVCVATSWLLFAPASALAHKAHEVAAREKAEAEAREKVEEAAAKLQLQLDRAENQAHLEQAEPGPDPSAEDADHAEPDVPSDQPNHHVHAAHSPTMGSTEKASVSGESESNVPKLLAWLGKFHPLVTHFPIALLAAAALAELLYMRTGKEQFDHAVRFSVWLGAGAALLAAPLGWFFGGFHLIDEEWVMTAHRWFGTGTAVWAGGLLLITRQLDQSDALRSRYRLVLFAGAGLVSITGFLGGSLLYGIDHYAW
jgi:uncharacterized membrane protein